MRSIWVVVLGLVVVAAVLFLIPFQAHSQVPSITLDWTATGDDGVVGTATSYELRFSSTKPDTATTALMDSWWNAATVVTSGYPTPTIAGTPQSMVVAVTGGFQTGRTYYFVMKVCDEVPNCSSYSNVATKFLPDTIPPSRLVDLRTR